MSHNLPVTVSEAEPLTLQGRGGQEEELWHKEGLGQLSQVGQIRTPSPAFILIGKLTCTLNSLPEETPLPKNPGSWEKGGGW